MNLGQYLAKALLEDNKPEPSRLTESQTATIGEFVKYACKNLGIQNPPRNLTFSYDNDAAKEKRSFGYFEIGIAHV